MRALFMMAALFTLGCNNPQSDTSTTVVAANDTSVVETSENPAKKTTKAWKGTLDGKTPVFIHYTITESLLEGEIVYLNTTTKTPIKLLGTIESDSSYRMLEFEKSGNITGIITGTPSINRFDGTWFSPKTRKELNLQLEQKDSIIQQAPSTENIYGRYYYQYSAVGPQGSFEIKKLDSNRAIFDIQCVTGEPARNMATVNNDTVEVKNASFTYHLPGSDSCEFSITFKPGYVHIAYTKQNCDGQFGHNATVEGIYLKQ